jgi:hypothetical protein
VHDQRTGLLANSLPAGAVRLNDLGFFNLKGFAADQANGVYFFSRYKVGTQVSRQDGQALDLVAYLRAQRAVARDLPIQLGVQCLPCRLIALPLPPEQVVGCWRRLDRSLHQAAQVIHKRAFCLLDALNDLAALIVCLDKTAQVMADCCYLSKRAVQPLTFQRWLEGDYA